MKDKKLDILQRYAMKKHFVLLSKTTIIDGTIHASQSEVSGVNCCFEVGYELRAVPSYDFSNERKTFLPNLAFIDYPTWTDMPTSIGL
jgi:hypothetical protein